MVKNDCFMILEYIRSSIEIIMNLKIEDLEKEKTTNGPLGKDAETRSNLDSKSNCETTFSVSS